MADLLPSMLRVIDYSLVLDPDMPLKGFRDYLNGLLACREQAVCKHCGANIERHEDEIWYHNDPARMRGCRAASFREGAGWNDDLPRNTYARPKHE